MCLVTLRTPAVQNWNNIKCSYANAEENVVLNVKKKSNCGLKAYIYALIYISKQ